MERLNRRFAVADAALASFEEIVRAPFATALERDAAILRFQYSFETVWKAAQEVLREREGVDAGSPKSAVRSCVSAGFVGAEEGAQLLQLIDDRNLTVHTYNEALALQLAGRLDHHPRSLRRWLDALRSRMETA